MTRRPLPLALVLLVVAGAWTRKAWAEEPARKLSEREFHAGYDRLPSRGGPNSLQNDLRRHDAVKETFFRLHVIESVLRPYYAFKKKLNDRWGLAFGLDFNILYQVADADTSPREAGSGVFRFYGKWVLLGRGSPAGGGFVFRVENRHALGDLIGTNRLGAAIGSLFSTSTSFAEWGWGITNLQWQHFLQDGRYAMAVGIVDVRDWVDPFDLSNWRTALLSPAVTFPVTRLPSAGLGAAVHAYFRKRNTPYVLAALCDANGDATRLGLDTFFDDREFTTFVELGWTPSYERRSSDNLRITYWHQDPREEAGTSESWGLTFSAAWKFADRLAPFLRGGVSEGGAVPAKAALAGGLGIHRRSHDLFGVALGWARPREAGLRDQTTFEAFYRLQISQTVGITPDVQLLIHPSSAPDETVIGVFSLRVQFAF